MLDHTQVEETIRAHILNASEVPESMSEMENTIRRVLYWVGNIWLHVWLMWLEPQYAAREKSCPHCQKQSQYERKRWGSLQTLYGKVPYRRAYYLCSHCHQGHYPLDEQLGLRPNAMSAEVERLAGLVGVQDAFAKGSELFEALTLVKLSDQSLRKATCAYGREAEACEQAWQAEGEDAEALLAQQRTAPRPLRLYGSLDGGRVQTRAPKGEPQPWRELKVLAWFNARGRPPQSPTDTWRIQAEQITYATDICSAEQFGDLLWASGVQRQAHLAHELIFLGDGAAWIWNLVDLHFPHAIQIVDWFHACEYLTPVAKVVDADPTQQTAWLKQVKQALWDGDLETVIAACTQHINPLRDDDPAQTALTYYTNNRHRMDYATYRANGYQIGSGTIESGIKQIAEKRLKVAGARWNLSAARLVAKARAAFLSDQWQTLAARRQSLNSAA